MLKIGDFGAIDHFVVCTKTFLDVIEPYKNVKQEFSLGLDYIRYIVYETSHPAFMIVIPLVKIMY